MEKQNGGNKFTRGVARKKKKGASPKFWGGGKSNWVFQTKALETGQEGGKLLKPPLSAK